MKEKINKKGHSESFSWLKLDNAAKIYPAAASRNWLAMFRLCATLNENIDPAYLQEALNITIKRFPSFALRLKRGLFWYYLEPIYENPIIGEDAGNPCINMRMENHRGYMFRVRYYENRIAVEIFHALTDGSGGLCFLETLTAEYLRLRYQAIIPRGGYILDTSQPPNPEEWEDCFVKYARNAAISRKQPVAYHIKGTPEDKDFANIITAAINVDQIKAKAKEYDLSVTEFIVSHQLYALQRLQSEELRASRRSMLLKVSVPVNLRQFYNARTVRNFSSYVNPDIDPKYGFFTFEEIARRVKHFMGLEVTEKRMNARMSANVMTENNPFIRRAPLFLKNPAMKLFYYLQGDRCNSMNFSNLGVAKLPEEMDKYVQRIDFIIGPLNYNPITTSCISHKGTLYLSFTGKIKQRTIQRYILTEMVKMGIHIKVESNYTE